MHTSPDDRDRQSRTSLMLSRTSKVVYVFGFWIIVSTVSMIGLAAGACRSVTPDESLLALGFFINVALFLFFLSGFNMFRIGRIFGIPPSRRARILFLGSMLTFCIAATALTTIVVAFPTSFAVFGSFLRSLGSPLLDMISLGTMFAGLLWLVCGGLAIKRIFDVISGIPGLVSEIRSGHRILFWRPKRTGIVAASVGIIVSLLLWGPYLLALLFYPEVAGLVEAAVVVVGSIAAAFLGAALLVAFAATLSRLARK